MDSDVTFKPKRFIAHDPDGPYSFKRQNYDEATTAILENLFQVKYPARYAVLRRFFEKNTVDPYLLMVRAWVHMQLNEEHGALGYLKKAQFMVASNSENDPLVDSRVQELETDLQDFQREDDDQWDSLGDDCEFSHFTVKWKPLSPLRIPIESREVRHHLSEVLNSWKSLSEDSRTAYSRYMAIESNELEGVFKLTQQSSARLVHLGFLDSTVVIERKGSVYTGENDNGRTLALICVDFLNGLQKITELSEKQMLDSRTAPATSIDINQPFARTSMRGNSKLDLVTVCSLHETVMRHAAISLLEHTDCGEYWTLLQAGALRQGLVRSYDVCQEPLDPLDPSSELVEKVGLVQYCPRWEVEAQLVKALQLYEEYSVQHRRSPYEMLSVAVWLHGTFAAIHPFGDGNGRVGRLIASIPTISAGLPPITIDPKNKTEYFRAMNDFQATGGVLPLMEFFLANMKRAIDFVSDNLVPLCEGSQCHPRTFQSPRPVPQ